LTVTSHLAKTSLNSRDPVLLVDPEKELYRRFTPREAARIQSFPDTFEFTVSEFDTYKQIGNAIPPVMFWHIAKSISDFLSDEVKK
jgi:DNA (cytosine-5)-methyltransferase 1